MHNPPLPLAVLIVFGSAKLLSELFERFGQPGIIGEILAGVLLGPAVLGWIEPNDLLKALADLGLLFLLFGTGLEVKSSELLKVGWTAARVAVAGMVVSFAAGWAVLSLWGAPRIESILVGASIMSSSVGITARFLSTKGVLSEKASQIILAAAVIDDVLGLIVLAVISSLAKGKINVLEILLTAVFAIAFTAAVAHWGANAVRRAIPHFESRLRAGEAQFHLSMVLLFALAALALDAGVVSIVGAFLAGMAMAESAGQRVRDLTQGVSELLVPFFLVGIGLHLQLSVFGQTSTILLSVTLLVVAIAAKISGCGLGAYPLGWNMMAKIGCGMVPRVEVGIVVAQVGLALSAITGEIYAVVIFVAVGTTAITPLLLKYVFPAR